LRWFWKSDCGCSDRLGCMIPGVWVNQYHRGHPLGTQYIASMPDDDVAHYTKSDQCFVL
jgi:hypothetical protein